MKKNLSILMLLTSSVLLSQTVYAYDENKEDEKIIVAEGHGNVSQDAVDRANELLNELPDELLEEFVDYGYRFFITDMNIAHTFFPGVYNSVKGVFQTDRHEIYVEERSEAVETATLHEFAHYLDYINGYPSKSSELQAIFNAESNDFVEKYDVDFFYNVGEFLADGVYRYYTPEYKNTLETYCPRLTDFIEDMIENSHNCVDIFSDGINMS